MATITRDNVVHVANLARIDLTDAEIDKLTQELDVIVESIQRVNQVATPDVPRTSHPLPLRNVWRDDVHEPPLSQEAALAMAPEAEDGKFAVPQILGEE